MIYSKKVLKHWPLQVKGDEGLDYTKCLTNKVFGKEAIMADLLYFKYYFLDALRKPYDKQKLIDDFEALSNYLTHTEYKYFMFRDFQSRNIIGNTKMASCSFHRLPGRMKGAPNMMWPACSGRQGRICPKNGKRICLTDYMNAFEKIIGQSIDRDYFPQPV